MKIEVNLLDVDKDTDKARACAVALLSALPQDEAHQAVAEWRAVCAARTEDANAPMEAAAGPMRRETFEAASAEIRTSLRALQTAAATLDQDLQEVQATVAMIEEGAYQTNTPAQCLETVTAIVHRTSDSTISIQVPGLKPTDTVIFQADPAFAFLDEPKAPVPPQDAGPPAELKAGFAATRAEVSALQEAATTPPQNVGYSAPPEHVDQPGVAAAKARQHPDYQVGGWVVTDLGELAQVAATRVGKDGAYLTVEVDEGEKIPFDKLIHVERVRPATTAEVLAGAARDAMGTATPDSQPVQDAGEKKKRGRPRKVTTPPESNGSAAETATAEVTTRGQADFPPQAVADGGVGKGPMPLQRMIDQEKAVKYAATSDKDLCKLAEHYVTRQKLFDLFKEHGVDKLGADAAKDAALRAAVLELVP